MKQTVQECRDNDRIMEQFGPVGEGLVGGDNGTGLLIPIGNESEKEIAFLSVNRRIPNLIHDHQRRFVVASASPFSLGAMIFFQLSDQVLHCGKVDAQAGLTGLEGERYGQMGLADAGRPQEDHIALLLDKGQIKKKDITF
jgi:hypothetical protein